MSYNYPSRSLIYLKLAFTQPIYTCIPFTTKCSGHSSAFFSTLISRIESLRVNRRLRILGVQVINLRQHCLVVLNLIRIRIYSSLGLLCGLGDGWRWRLWCCLGGTNGLNCIIFGVGLESWVFVSDSTPPSSPWKRLLSAGELTSASGLLRVWFAKYVCLFVNI